MCSVLGWVLLHAAVGLAAVGAGTRGCAEGPAPAQVTPQAREVAEANNQFAVDLFAAVRERAGNLLFSPLSVSTAFSMTSGGARGETAAQILSTLRLAELGERIHGGFGALLGVLAPTEAAPGYELSIASALWTNDNHPFRPEYTQLVRTNYRAEVRNLDFLKSDEARRTINEWVASKTRDRIQDLIPPNVLNPATKLVLTNAICFKGRWKEEFKPSKTKNADFFATPGEKFSVPMMHRADTLRGLENDDVEVLELPYRGDAVRMIVILPRQKGELLKVESLLTAETLGGWIDGLRSAEIDVALPKFKFVSEFRLDESLQKLGVRDAFGTAADFSGMDGTKDLYIQAAIHKAFIDVNEEGTEAAAATGISIAQASLPRRMKFRADHPFLFLIRDSRSGSILFMGRVADPR